MTKDDELTARDRAAFLLTLVCAYRRKRAVDGMNGRMWDGSVHLSAECEIDALEAQWLTVRESTSTPLAAAPVSCAPADRRCCCAPAPDRSGRRCDKPRGHAGDHWTFAGHATTWRATDRPDATTTGSSYCCARCSVAFSHIPATMTYVFCSTACWEHWRAVVREGVEAAAGRVKLCTCSVVTGGHIAASPACPIHRPAEDQPR